MAVLTGLTAARMLLVEASTVVAGNVVGPDLILQRRDASTFNAGKVAPVIVTALPGSPVDGQEVYFQSTAMAAAGVIWHLRYRSGASGSYKWEYLGGPPLSSALANPGQQTTINTFQDLAGPTVALPLAGDFDVYGEVTVNDASAALVLAKLVVGTTSAPGARMTAPAFQGAAFARQSRIVAQAAAALAKMQFYTSVAQSASYGWTDCIVRITPVRVG
ncbi:MAG TPA: hypothetical protein PKD12_08185 [Nitrospira sp.]|nr:hypothetical protein [Nitrospira sp.]